MIIMNQMPFILCRHFVFHPQGFLLDLKDPELVLPWLRGDYRSLVTHNKLKQSIERSSLGLNPPVVTRFCPKAGKI